METERNTRKDTSPAAVTTLLISYTACGMQTGLRVKYIASNITEHGTV